MLPKILNLLILSFICLHLTGCLDVNIEVYTNKSLEELSSLAKKDKKPYCIVLVDSCQDLSKEYSWYLCNDYKYLLKKSIYNFVNIRSVENEWYLKWLSPVSIPLTCVFSPAGKLIDLIPGAAKETFLYTDLALKNGDVTDYHWPNRFNMNKREVVSLLGNLLSHKIYLKQGVYLRDELKEISDSLHYPFVEYLRLIGELKENEKLQSQCVAKNLLKYESSYNLDLYNQEFITAKKVIDPNFDIMDEPTIAVDENVLYLSNCKVDHNVPIDVTIFNKGNKPLKIYSIYTSCSCLKQLNYTLKDELEVRGQDSIIIKFDFTANTTEEIYREVFINSNAINMPVYHIEIIANSQK